MLKLKEREFCFAVSSVCPSVLEMGSAEHGEMKMPADAPKAPEMPERDETSEKPEAPLPDVPSLPAMPKLSPLKPVMEAAAKEAEDREAEWTEPSASKPDGETEVKSQQGLTVEEAMELEQNAAKRQRLDPSEVANEGVPDTDLIIQLMRLCQSSLEYTARQSKSLQEIQTQLGETSSLAFHSESCMRYALSGINQASGNLKGVHWQLTGGRNSEHVSCKSLLQTIASATSKMEKAMGKMVESLDQSAEQNKKTGELLLSLQGQVADAFSRMTSSVPAAPPMGGTPAPSMGATPVTPMGGTPVTSMGGAPMVMTASAMGATAPSFPPQPVGAAAGNVGIHHVPPPPAPVPVARNIVVQVRSPDGQVMQRAASPTRYVDEVYRTNPSYLWCDDGCFRRLI
eukprot:s658_g1.t1